MMFGIDSGRSLRLALAALVLVLSACATRPIEIEDGPQIETREGGGPAAEEPQRAPQNSDLALNQLLKDAHRHLAAENWEAASASAERGLRIDRREPELYLVLARAYLGLADPRRALEFVRQGLRYASNELSPVTIDLKRLQASLGN